MTPLTIKKIPDPRGCAALVIPHRILAGKMFLRAAGGYIVGSGSAR